MRRRPQVAGAGWHRAARAALAREQQAEPRTHGLREALRQILVTRQAVLVSRTKAINELKSLIVVAPELLLAGLRGVSLPTQLQRIAALDSPAGATVEHRVTMLTLRSRARIEILFAQAAELDPELVALVKAHPAGHALLAEPGVGPVVAAQLLVELVAPRPCPQRSRLRLPSRRGAPGGQQRSTQPTPTQPRRRPRSQPCLHTVAITRLRWHPESRAYEIKRTAQGKTHRDVRRSLKRALARRPYRRIEAATGPTSPARRS